MTWRTIYRNVCLGSQFVVEPHQPEPPNGDRAAITNGMAQWSAGDRTVVRLDRPAEQIMALRIRASFERPTWAAAPRTVIAGAGAPDAASMVVALTGNALRPPMLRHVAGSDHPVDFTTKPRVVCAPATWFDLPPDAPHAPRAVAPVVIDLTRQSETELVHVEANWLLGGPCVLTVESPSAGHITQTSVAHGFAPPPVIDRVFFGGGIGHQQMRLQFAAVDVMDLESIAPTLRRIFPEVSIEEAPLTDQCWAEVEHAAIAATQRSASVLADTLSTIDLRSAQTQVAGRYRARGPAAVAAYLTRFIDARDREAMLPAAESKPCRAFLEQAQREAIASSERFAASWEIWCE